MGGSPPERGALTTRALGARSADDDAGWLRLDHEIAFSLGVALPHAQALDFVRDVELSLRHADFLANLRVTGGEVPTVSAELPVDGGPFGVRTLPFESVVEVTPYGARLVPRRLELGGDGWAEVRGEAKVLTVAGSRPGTSLDYAFDITLHLATPSAERWGTQALLKMVELTASTVLRKVAGRFPRALEASAAEASRAARVSRVPGE